VELEKKSVRTPSSPSLSVGKGTRDELNSSGGDVSSTNVDILQSRQERKFSPLVSTSEGKGGKEMRRE
jgi:hypothetical protein